MAARRKRGLITGGEYALKRGKGRGYHTSERPYIFSLRNTSLSLLSMKSNLSTKGIPIEKKEGVRAK